MIDSESVLYILPSCSGPFHWHPIRTYLHVVGRSSHSFCSWRSNDLLGNSLPQNWNQRKLKIQLTTLGWNVSMSNEIFTPLNYQNFTKYELATSTEEHPPKKSLPRVPNICNKITKKIYLLDNHLAIRTLLFRRPNSWMQYS